MMPAAHAEWARAMLAEAEHLPPRDQLAFARGCLWSSYRERLSDPASKLAAGQWSAGLGLCAGSLICFRTAGLLQFHAVSTMILLLGLIGLAAAAAFARWGHRLLPLIAVTGLGAALLAMLGAGDPAALVNGAAPHGGFYRAILLEQVAAWAALFALGRFLIHLDAGRRAYD
jgi:hypothetical protein